MILKILGIILILDGIISIVLASPSRVTSNIFNLNPLAIVWLGHLFRIIRVILGVLLIILPVSTLSSYLIILGIYLIIDSASSIFTASSFNSADDYLRLSRIILGGILIFGRKVL